ncbi:uracil-DNA glycosylase [Arthrobacter sp. M4]|uniref:uracil-DNA glycosylase n=1 Tax=Arthrobacter sp. M4 TaxID=218160 RepID=UPI001CDCC863|nr:uracil-DNA glycosylase [Arthrobacter sp. M4]MCA4133809.1 uracil-DNA glycosylase [Arthrobacter sp. M4]
MHREETLFDISTTSDDAQALATMATAPLTDLVANDWAEAFLPVEGDLRRALEFASHQALAGVQVLPEPANILRAFQQPLHQVKVLIIGQDPYPTPGHAVGLSFAVSARTRPLPRSLANIYRELESDVGLPARVHGDLSAWADQGVLLLNRVLTVGSGAAGSHKGRGWEAVTAAAVKALAARRTADGGRMPLVAVLWGKEAESLLPLLDGTPVITSAHPSPLSAARGFFGSKPFSRVNQLLVEQGAEPVMWELPAVA